MPLRPLLRLLTAHLVVALVALVVIGGATRVMEAGLACPDWPLCYGVLLPGRQMNVQVFLEWFHRLDAFLVGIALLVFWILTLLRRRQLPSWLPWMSSLALCLVAFQGGLGALTVSGLLSWSTVTAHLATALLLLLFISGLDQFLDVEASPQPPLNWWLPLPWISTALVFSQCVLGAAMASQWAVDHCFTSGDQCELLLRHRQLALPAGLTVVAMAGSLFFAHGVDGRLRTLSLGAAALVVMQVTLGILTLRSQLQLPSLTIAHQLVAALLIAHLGALMGRTLQSWLLRPAPSSLEMTCG